jgi:hypothetical protein
MKWTTIFPVKHAIQIRQLRYKALIRWRVGPITTALPGMLQMSLILFFGGLAVLLWPLDFIVSACVMGSVAVAVMLYILAIGISVINSDCPYKTPIGWLLRSVSLWAVTKLTSITLTTIRTVARLRHPKRSRSADNCHITEFHDPAKCAPVPKIFSLVHSLHHFFDRHLQESYGTWVRKDLLVHAACNGPAYGTSWMCRCLLWACAHENLETAFIQGCTRDLSVVPRWMPGVDQTRTDASLTAAWPDHPLKRLYGCWTAISDTIHERAHHSFRSRTAYAHLQEAYQNFYASGSLEVSNYQSCLTNIKSLFMDEIRALVPAQRVAMFYMLYYTISDVLDREALDHSSSLEPMTGNESAYLGVNSLTIMVLLCDTDERLEEPCHELLKKTRRGGVPHPLSWPQPVTASEFCDNLLICRHNIEAGPCRCNERQMAQTPP